MNKKINPTYNLGKNRKAHIFKTTNLPVFRNNLHHFDLFLNIDRVQTIWYWHHKAYIFVFVFFGGDK